VRANFLLDSESQLAPPWPGSPPPRPREARDDQEDHRVLREQPGSGAPRRRGPVRSPLLHLREIKLDALPDLSDTQVIIYSKWDARPTSLKTGYVPDHLALLGAPDVRRSAVSPTSGFSYVYVDLQGRTDIYWRARACSNTSPRSRLASQRA